MAYCGCCGSCMSYYGNNDVLNPCVMGECDVRQIEVSPSRSADDCPYYRPENNDNDKDKDDDFYW